MSGSSRNFTAGTGALLLSMQTQRPCWWTVQSMVFGVVLFTLLVQGTTASRLIALWQRLGSGAPEGR